MKDYGNETRVSINAVTGPAALLVALIAMVLALWAPAGAAPHHKPAAHHKITAKQLAPGAVTAKAIRKGAVTAKALAEGAVTAPAISPNAVGATALAEGAVSARAIAPDAVTKAAVAPGSIYGGALGAESIHMVPILDRDEVASNPQWTASDTAVALCGAGEALLGTGFFFTEPGNREVGFLGVKPVLATTGNGVAGEITSNSGGTAAAQVMAICLGG
jgi:hypothetical protein